MKKAIFFLFGCTNTKHNEFESCRGEGRASFNIAFGFSLLGYESHIINDWNIENPKKIWDNVYIKNNYDPNEIYDIAFSFDNYDVLNNKNFKHKILMNYAHTDILLEKLKEQNLDITVVCPVPSIMRDSSTFQYKCEDVHYLPGLNPIPSINVGFVPYNFEPNFPELKVYVDHSSWPGSTTRSPYYVSKQLLILEFLKSKGYELNLFVHVENEGVINTCPFVKEDGVKKIHYINNEKTYYDEIIKMLKVVDLCIPSRAGYDAYGSSATDIIALGKSMISIVDGAPRKEFTHNGFYKCSENLIIVQEPDDKSYEKLERIFSDLEKTYNCYKEQLIDTDFNNWKILAENVINLNI